MIHFLRCIAALPLSVLHRLGALLGRLVYAASPTYRRHLDENLTAAFPAEADALRSAAVGHAGRMVAELPRIWLRPIAETERLVTRVSGWELVEQAWRRGTGLILLTPHLGCFEITARYIAARAPITVLYRPPKQAWLQPLIESGRGGGNLHLARADLGGVRVLMRALKRNETIGMLPDQVPSLGEGLWSEFFGRPAYTMSLAARLTEASPATLLFLYAERLPKGGGFHLKLFEPVEPIAGTTAARVAAINRSLEALIRDCPAQYLWSYNRYKVPAGVEPAPAEGRAR